MPGLVPGIHALANIKDVDGRDKPGHDNSERFAMRQARLTLRAVCAFLSSQSRVTRIP
jgi:hypothetical protein